MNWFMRRVVAPAVEPILSREWLVFSLIILGIVGGTGLFAWYGAGKESEAFNRLTGAHTTAWDAFWLDLRVQERPK